MKKLLIFPFGGNGREALVSVLAAQGEADGWEVVGFIDDDPALLGKECCGVKVIGGRDALGKHPEAFVLAVPGNPGNYAVREGIIAGLSVDSSRFATVAHPSTVISPDSKIGYNTLLMPNVFVGPGAEVGNHCIVLPNSVISHDSRVSDYCCIGSNVSISGGVKIGKSSYIGSGAKIRERLNIGDRVLVGLGSVVVSDVRSDVVAYGNPARVIRERAR